MILDPLRLTKPSRWQRIVLLAFCAPLAGYAAVSLAGEVGHQDDIRVGVYYFPGWSPNIPEAPRVDPWQPIRKYPSRMPAAGEYQDSDPRTLRRQLREMKAADLSFVVFDTYTGRGGASRGDQAVDAYRTVATQKDPKFAVMWANHDDHLKSLGDWDAMMTRWIRLYLTDKRYLRVSGRPVVFIFSANNLEQRAQSFGSSTTQLLERAQQMASALNGQRISFVAGGGPRPSLIKGEASTWGYAALSDYNMGTSEYPAQGSGYARRAFVYSRYWEVYRRDADLPVILPITAGWDKAPWGGSNEDGAIPTPAELTKHVSAAMGLLERQTSSLGRLGVICCWNEYGEGSVLEPTKGRGSKLLDAVHTALNSRKQKPPTVTAN